MAAQAEAGQQIKVTWTDNSGQGMALPTDKLLLVIYSPTAGLFQISEGAATRADAELTVTVDLAGTPVHCWVTFVSETGKHAASSTYLGEVEVMA